jgi:5-methylcytosine-specific restriction endonuclease McrA
MDRNRRQGSDRNGNNFSEATKFAVWQKASKIDGLDPSRVRKDSCGATITWVNYGQTTSTGWEIDHITAVANGGGDEITNLQPLHWKNNRSKSDSLPGQWTCSIRS